MSGKKKSDLSTSLDDLRNEDPKKRIAALADLKDIAAAIGPTRVRAELIGFLAQFLEDEESVVMELLSQLQNFASCLGGPEQQKCLIPLLMSFCKTDQKRPALRATALMKRILTGNKDLALDTIKKLMKTEMNLAKECGVQLMAGLLPQLQGSEPVLMQLYGGLMSNDNLQLKIIAAKYLQDVLRNLKGKEECGKILENIYSEGDDLAKIFAMKALVDYYDISSNFSLTKFKNLSVVNSWRINIKICDLIDVISTKITKPHFKLIFEPILLKFMVSSEPELRAASCKTLSAVTKSLSEEQMKAKVIPLIKKLAVDSVDYVKVELSKNIVALCGIVSAQLMNDCLLPIIFTFIKDPNSEISLGVVKSFDYLSTRMGREVLQQKIIKPLLTQLSNDNWRNKCQIIEILRGFLVNQSYLTDNVLKVLFGLTDDRIDAVRLKVNQFIVDIVAKNGKEWCEQNIIPRVYAMKDNASYTKKQNLLEIIEKTIPYVSDKTLREVYQNAVVCCLNDKVSNVRVRTIQLLKTSGKLNGAAVEKQLQKLKDDKDIEVKEAMKRLRG